MQATAKLHGYTGFAALCLVAALLLRRGELAVIGAPFLLVAAVALVRTTPARIAASATLDTDRPLQDDVVTLSVRMRSEGVVAHVELHLPVPPALRVIHRAAPWATT